MNIIRYPTLLLMLFAGAFLSTHRLGAAESWLFTRVFDSTYAIPGGEGTFEDFSSMVLSGGRIVFRASGGNGQEGIYLWDGDQIHLVADYSTPIPEGDGTFSSLFSAGISHDKVVFTGYGPNSQRGIYQWSDGVLTRLVDRNTPIPGTTTNFNIITTPVSRDGRTIFYGGSGIYLIEGAQVSTLADQSVAVPGSTGTFNQFSSPSIFGSGYGFIAYNHGVGNSENGLYGAFGGDILKIVDRGDTVPGEASGFAVFNNPMAGPDTLMFEGWSEDGPHGIYRYSSAGGALEQLAVEGGPAPDPLGSFRTLNLVGYDGQNFALFANTQGGATGSAQAVIAGLPGELSVVYQTGDTSLDPNATPNFLRPGDNVIDGKTVVFAVRFSNGVMGMFLANAASQGPRIRSISVEGAEVELEVEDFVEGGIRFLQRSEDLEGPWTTVKLYISTAGTVTLTDPVQSGDGPYYYRIQDEEGGS